MAKKFTQIVGHDINYEVIGFRRKFLTISGIVFIASLICIFSRGLNFGIDFSGGTEIQVEFRPDVAKQQAAALKFGTFKSSLTKLFPKKKMQVQQVGAEGRSFMVKFGEVSSLTEEQLKGLKADIKKNFAAFINPKRDDFFRFRSEGGNKIDLRFVNKNSASSKPASRPAKGAKPGKKKKKVAHQIDIALLKKIFKKNGIDGANPGDPVLRRSGFEYNVTFSDLSNKFKQQLATLFPPVSLSKGLPKKPAFAVLRVETVGPRVGKKLRNDGILALLLANLFILVYIAIRFDFRYAPGATAALVHDITITAGLFSALWLPFDLSIIAALLTIVGYSLNDTIVVYDRIRENWEKSRFNFGEVMNRSINETLSRTLLTSITTFLAVLPIYIFGGGNIRWFAFAMMFGILIGTYSSIAIASPLVYYLDQYFTKKEREMQDEAEEKRERRRRRRAGLAS